MSKEKSRQSLILDLAKHIEMWVNDKTENGNEWFDADIGYVHDGIYDDMAKSAMLILTALSDAQRYAIDGGFLKS